MIAGMRNDRRSRQATGTVMDERDGRGPGRRRRGVRDREDPRLDDDPVRMASPEEVLAALEQLDLERPWEEMAPAVRPVLPRWRPFAGKVDSAPVRSWPPGIESAFGLDVGPAFLYLDEWALERWGITFDVLAERALDNVRRWAEAMPAFELQAEVITDIPTRILQTRDGWASTLLLVPDQLARAFGPEPCLVIAPMRDLVLALPVDTEPELAAWLMDELAHLDPNGLALPVFALVDGRLSIVPVPGEDGAVRGRRH